MSKEGGAARDSQENLKLALASGGLSTGLQEKGQAILTRMQTPLRLSVFGMPGSGKSTLLNLLLGKSVFTSAHRLPTMSLVYGDAPQAVCTLPSGDRRTLETEDLDAIAALKPAFVELALPLPALRKLSMLEVVAGADLAEQQRALQWAAKRTDIGLWCTQTASPDEEQLWGLLPGNVLDHSFLVVTGVDSLGALGRLTDVMKDAKSIGPEYFRDVLPIATSLALDARKPDGSVDKATMRSSGGIALISAILKEVEVGERGAQDAADIFLRQIEKAKAKKQPETPEVEVPKSAQPKLVAVPPSPPPIEVELVADEPDTVPEDIAPEAAADIPDAVRAELSQVSRDMCAQVVEQLTAEGQALADNLSAGVLDPASVVEVSVDTVTWLADYLGDGAATDPAMARTRETANDAADLVQLIQLEKGENVALDALSLMIQLKQEIQAELAA